MDALEIVRNANILETDDYGKLEVIKKELQHTWRTAQVFRTRTEMVVSVLNDLKHPTPDSKYWQAVREQNVMFGELVNLSYEYRKKEVGLHKLENDMLTITDIFDLELSKIEAEHTQWELLNMERIAKDRIRELQEWSAIKSELLPHLKYGINEVDAHQLESMQLAFAEQAKLVNQHTPIADARNILGLAQTIKKRGKNVLR